MPITNQANGNFDSNNTGKLDSVAIFKVAGNKNLIANEKINMNGTIKLDSVRPNGTPVLVYYVANDTVSDVINKINDAGTDVVAYLDHANRLAVKATLAKDEDNKNFMIRHLEDSGNFLVNYSGVLKASGAVGAFDWKTVGSIAQFQANQNITITPQKNTSSWIGLDESVKNDVMKIAAAGGTDYQGKGKPDTMTGVGDGNSALKIADLRYKKAMIGEQATFDNYYTTVISEVGALQSEQAKLEYETDEKLYENLANLRKSISGVNMDEEIANMVTYQHAYNASARIITTADNMLQTILHMGAGA